MKAIITGASSGIGREMARILSDMGYDIIAVARREDRLISLKEELKGDVEVLCCDVSDPLQCKELAKRAKEAEIFINNAGFGVFGELCSTSIDGELKMLDTNIRAVHILTKSVAQIFKERNSGYILNVASLAAFFPGPLFAAYYASKSYVLMLSQALSEELRRDKSGVKVSVLCPGPVHTEFGDVAGVSFGLGNEKGGKLIVKDCRYVAEYAIKKMFAGKGVIIPGGLMKMAVFLRRILPDKILARAVCMIQREKCITK